jgi:pilus assembly protein CpaF
MKDATVEEIWINSPERVFIARNGRSELTNLLLTQEEVRNIVERSLNVERKKAGFIPPICGCAFT